MTSDLEPQVTLPWLVRLRWFAFAGLLLGLGLCRWVFRSDLVWWPCALSVALLGASNALLPALARRNPLPWPAAHTLGGVLTFDIALLTVLLAASGGAMNPFTVLYLVHITLSAVVLSARWTTFLSLVAVLGFGSLFLVEPSHDAPPTTHPHAGMHHPGMHHPGMHHSPDTDATATHAAATLAATTLPAAADESPSMHEHLRGMWVAFVLAAALTGIFVRRVARAISHQREQIAALREASAKNARLAALTTLAAGAAHELGSPLGTIAVAAREAERALAKRSELGGALDDVKLILLEVERCHQILSQMSTRAAAGPSEAESFDGAVLERELRAALAERDVERIDFSTDAPRAPERSGVPRGLVVQSVVALVRNALDASPPEERVSVSTNGKDSLLEICVTDCGSGIAEQALGRVGEPFFTTKEPGRGLGLGVFLARAFAESRGGVLTIESVLGKGTRAVLRVPTTRVGTAGILGAAE